MADALEVRIAHLEGAYEQIDKRLGDLRQEMTANFAQVRQEMTTNFAQVRQEIAQLRQETNELRRQMAEQFRWIVGLQVLAWVSILGTILALFFRS